VIGLLLLVATLAILIVATRVAALAKAFPLSQIEPSDYPAKIRHLAIILCGSITISLVNPYTYRVYEEVLRTNLDQFARAHIQEWLSINFQSPTGLMIGGFVFVLLWFLLWTRQYRSVWHLLLLPVYLYLGLSSVRNVTVLVLFVLPWLYMALTSQPAITHFFDVTVAKLFEIRRGNWAYYLYNAALVAVSLLVLVIRANTFVKYSADPALLDKASAYPSNAVAFLKVHAGPDERIFNEYQWGGYLTWYLPEYKVYIDGRMASWQDSNKHILEDYATIYEIRPKWLEQLEADRVTLVLVSKDSRLDNSLRQVSAYRCIYQDDVAVIYKKV
jgi:hypothetical protein